MGRVSQVEVLYGSITPEFEAIVGVLLAVVSRFGIRTLDSSSFTDVIFDDKV